MQCVINTLHTPKEDKRMKKAFIIIILCMILQIFTVTVYANDSNVNIVSADNYESREFNQWKRAKYNFSFNVSTEKKTIKALCSAVLTATGTAIGAGISSYASDCIEEHYSKFKKKGIWYFNYSYVWFKIARDYINIFRFSKNKISF